MTDPSQGNVERRFCSSSDTGASIVVGDKEVVRAPNLLDACILAERLPEGRNPFLIDMGDEIVIEVEPEDWAHILSRLRPSSALVNILDGLAEEAGYSDEGLFFRTPIDTGTCINGQRCGWFPSADDQSSTGSPFDDAQLVSLGFPEDAEVVASISAWMSGSMTGAVISAGYKHDALAGMAWLDNDDEGFDVSITYDLTNLNQEAKAALESLMSVFDGDHTLV